MFAVSQRFLTAMRSSHRVVVKVDAYLAGVLIAEDLPVTAGSVTVDRGSGVRRQLTLSIPDAAILPTIGAALTPYGVELHVARGVAYADGTTELVPLGVFRLDNGSNANSAPTTYTGPDRAKALIDARFLGPTPSAIGSDALSEITSLCHNVMLVDVVNDGVTSPEDGSDVLPLIPPVVWDRERWQAMEQLATSLGAELAFDVTGRLVLSPLPSITDEPVWQVDQGPTGVLVDYTRELSREDTYNGVVATGERSDGAYPARAVAIDDDPASPTEWNGPFGQVTYFYTSPLIHTPNGAQQVADALLGIKMALSRSVRLSCVPNPALDVGDVIAVRMPGGVDEKHLIDRLTIPLDTSSAMTIETRTPDPSITIVDPAPLPPVDVGPPVPPPILPPLAIPPPVLPPPLPPGVPTPGTLPNPGLPGDPPPEGEPVEVGEAFTLAAWEVDDGHWYVRYDDDSSTMVPSAGLSRFTELGPGVHPAWDPLGRGVSGDLHYRCGSHEAGAGIYPVYGLASTYRTHWIRGTGPDRFEFTEGPVGYSDALGNDLNLGKCPGGSRPMSYSWTNILQRGQVFDALPYRYNPRPRWLALYLSDRLLYPSVGFDDGDAVPAGRYNEIHDPAGRHEEAYLYYVSGAREERYWPDVSEGRFRVHWDHGDEGGGIDFSRDWGDMLLIGPWYNPGGSDHYVRTDIEEYVAGGGTTVVDKVPIIGDYTPPELVPGQQTFQLRHRPIRTLPEAVVRLDNVVARVATYDIDYEHGTLTVLQAMGGEPGDVVTVVYWIDPGGPPGGGP